MSHSKESCHVVFRARNMLWTCFFVVLLATASRSVRADEHDITSDIYVSRIFEFSPDPVGVTLNANSPLLTAAYFVVRF